jgi:hypothetical protein
MRHIQIRELKRVKREKRKIGNKSEDGDEAQLRGRQKRRN